jgi:UDP-N-acetylmuramoyl-tripeptide--D-alanyl-D-alanine ligase
VSNLRENLIKQGLEEARDWQLIQGKNLDQPIRDISTDTRSIEPGDCFIALRGERFDGHDFVEDAVLKGASTVIVQSGRTPVSIPEDILVIEVPDTLYALGELARYHRRSHPIPLVGITGSNGKTTTKEMIASILNQKNQVLKSKGNFNNLIGVPLTLLSLQPHHQVAVLEMGINVPGEMERLAEISEPSVGLITNIHAAHLQGLQSLEGVLEEKGKLWQTLRSPKRPPLVQEWKQTETLAVINRDDERLLHLSKALTVPTITYSLWDKRAQVHMEGEIENRDEESVFHLALGGETISVCIHALGIHHVQNAVAAAAVTYGMGESPETIALGLSTSQPVPQRMQIHRLEDGTVLIDDTYNANPMSVLAAVETLCAMPCVICEKPPSQVPYSAFHTSVAKVAVLGEMRELGSKSALLHREVGERIGRLGITQLVTLGDLALEINKGARQAGMKPTDCHHAQSQEEVTTRLRDNWIAGSRILVKGSRTMKMERIVESILEVQGNE